MVKPSRLALAVLILCLFAGPLAAAGLPDNLANESCQRRVRDDIEVEPGLTPDALLICSGKTAGHLITVRAARMQDPTPANLKSALLAAVRTPRVQNEMLGSLNCAAPQWIEPETGAAADTRLIAFACKNKNGGWPHLVIGRLHRGLFAVASGAPAQLPVLRALLEAPAAESGNEAQMRLLRQLFGNTVPLASAAELERFRQFITQARAANQKGLHGEAESLLREALITQTRLLGENDTSIADTLLDLGVLVSNLGRHEEAERLFARAGNLIDKSPRDEDRARLALYRGFDAANRGQFGDALKYAQASVALWRKLVQTGLAGIDALYTDPTNRDLERGELAFALNLVAQMAVRDQQLVLAQAAAAEALQILNTTTGLPPSWRADTLVALGEISIAQSRLSAAETYLNHAIDIRRRVFGDGPPVIRALAVLGRAYQQEGLYASAIITFREVLKLSARSELALAEILTEDDLIPFVQAAHDYARKLPAEAERQSVWAEAFAAFTLLRPSLVERTIARTADRFVQDNPVLADLIQQLAHANRAQDGARIDLALESAAPDEARSAIAERKLSDTIERSAAEIKRLHARLQSEFPDYQQLTTPTAPTLGQLQADLRPGEALLTFLIGRERSFAFLLSRDNVHLASVAETQSSLKNAVTRLRAAMVLEGRLMGAFDLRLAHQLHTSLLGGFGEALAGVDHLVIAQSGPLASLPFAILLTAPAQGNDYSQHAWLGARLATTNVPGMRAFHVLRSLPPRNTSRALLGIGNPVLLGAASDDDLATICRAKGPAPGRLIRAMAPLPDTATELQRIEAGLFAGRKSKLLLGQAASEAALRREPLDQYRVLYFASHALLPGELKCAAEPALVLTPPEQATSRDDDGLLDASEIARLKLKADLVVLSACNTAGAGGKFSGDALSGLAEAFFHAGTRALVASHWQVPSRATQQLMGQMFGELGPALDGDAARALQRAQKKMMADPDTAHPFFWGAFIVVGDGKSAAPAQVAGQGAAP